MHMKDTNLGHIINYILKHSSVFKCEREKGTRRTVKVTNNICTPVASMLVCVLTLS